MELETRTLEVSDVPITARYEVRYYGAALPRPQAIIKAVYIGDCPQNVFEMLTGEAIDDIAVAIEDAIQSEESHSIKRRIEQAELRADHDRTEARAINAERGNV